MRMPVPEEDEKPARTPVPPAGRVAPLPISEDGYRQCLRVGCDNYFVPRSRALKTTDATEHYCSTECAVVEHWRKHRLGAPPKAIERATEQNAVRTTREKRKEAKREARAAREDEKTARYGPRRAIVSEEQTKKGSRLVTYECGHKRVLSPRAKAGRCSKCKPHSTEESTA